MRHTKYNFIQQWQSKTKQTMTKDAFIQRVRNQTRRVYHQLCSSLLFFSLPTFDSHSTCCGIGSFRGRATHILNHSSYNLLICNLKLKLLYLNYDVFVTARLHDLMANVCKEGNPLFRCERIINETRKLAETTVSPCIRKFFKLKKDRRLS